MLLPGAAHQRVDQFNLKQCACVIGIFGIITIISYFNELAKLGLLRGPAYPRAATPLHQRQAVFSTPPHQTSAIQHGEASLGIDVEQLKSVLRSNTTRRHRGNRSVDDVTDDVNDVLSVSLHLGKHTAYNTVVNEKNNSRTPGAVSVAVFQHKNTLPNYYLSLSAYHGNATVQHHQHLATHSIATYAGHSGDSVVQSGNHGGTAMETQSDTLSIAPQHSSDGDLAKNADTDLPYTSKTQLSTGEIYSEHLSSTLENTLLANAEVPDPRVSQSVLKHPSKTSFSNDTSNMTLSISEFIEHQQEYSNATKVFLYQHELAGYSMRDCFKLKSQEAGLNLLTSPVNQNYRSEWEVLPVGKRNKYDAIFGGVSFGVCETLNKPCMYFTMLTHPLDRILQVYYYCRKSKVNSLCSFSKSNVTEKDLYHFIKSSGNTYFKKLLYYSKHCKLLGKDQVCIQDSKTSFILSTSERKVLLEDILSNLENWFAVIGLVDHYKDSLKLFEHVLGLEFTKCNAFNHTAIGKYLPPGADRGFLNESRKIHRSIKSIRQKLLKDPKITQWLIADLAIYDKMAELYQKQWGVYLTLKRQDLTGKHLARAKSKLYANAQGLEKTRTENANTTKKHHNKQNSKYKSEKVRDLFSISTLSASETSYDLKQRIGQRKSPEQRKVRGQKRKETASREIQVSNVGKTTNRRAFGNFRNYEMQEFKPRIVKEGEATRDARNYKAAYANEVQYANQQQQYANLATQDGTHNVKQTDNVLRKYHTIQRQTQLQPMGSNYPYTRRGQTSTLYRTYGRRSPYLEPSEYDNVGTDGSKDYSKQSSFSSYYVSDAKRNDYYDDR